MLSKFKLKISKEFKRIFQYRILKISRLYKLCEQEHLKRLLPYFNVDCVFDIGANNGQYAEQLRRKIGFKGLIISFEPNPDAASILKKAAKKDKYWIVEEIALSDKDGEQIFNIMEGSQFSSLSKPISGKGSLSIKANTIKRSLSVRTETLLTTYKRLQKIYNFKKPFLKLDSQGYDLTIVNSGKPILNNFIGLQSELSIQKLYENSIDFKKSITQYEDLGFILSAFVPNNSGHFPDLIETDCIMVRKDLTTISQ